MENPPPSPPRVFGNSDVSSRARFQTIMSGDSGQVDHRQVIVRSNKSPGRSPPQTPEGSAAENETGKETYRTLRKIRRTQKAVESQVYDSVDSEAGHGRDHTHGHGHGNRTTHSNDDMTDNPLLSRTKPLFLSDDDGAGSDPPSHGVAQPPTSQHTPDLDTHHTRVAFGNSVGQTNDQLLAYETYDGGEPRSDEWHASRLLYLQTLL
ncbi:hypothetical protein BS47DRAFT_1398365 [Hydnum rufescens UP504]|uniref:Uncharacterized protein n=1 Tax=Hydnum rufescens UP504 TaxID=1448309 RepID=A0A9P6DNB9_9AGAM|nr:hypothetical protein BS47DRAFT_1398365 [Hydnum rufescens UP504]